MPSLDQLRHELTAEQASEQFLWQLAAAILEAQKAAQELKGVKSQNLTLHRDCVSVLGYGVLLVNAVNISRYHPGLYDIVETYYYCGKGRRHRAYWVQPKQESEE